MSEIQKVIKYLAIAFAIFLSVNIIGGMITALFFGLSIFGFVTEKQEQKGSQPISSQKIEMIQNSEEIENLKAELASTQEALDAKNREYSELKRRTNIQKCYDLEDERKTNAQLQSRIKDLESRIVSDELVRAFKEKAMLYDAAQREFEDNREKYARLESEVERLRHAAG